MDRQARALRTVCVPLSEEFGMRIDLHRWASACRWSKESGHEGAVEATADCDLRLDALLNRMRAIRPRTLKGLAALAEAMKLDHLDQYWRETPNDRDWDKLLITELFDMVIAMGITGEARQSAFPSVA